MPSSTSSSDRARPDRQLRSAALAIGTFAALTALSVLVRESPPFLGRRTWVADAPIPAGGEYYLAAYKGEFDQLIFHNQFCSVRDGLERADVLFLGNSRLMFALSDGGVMRSLRGRGVRGYALGFGHGERNRFAEDLIVKYDLRPRLVVANADRFFTDDYSDTAREAVGKGRFDAMKAYFEFRAGFWARRGLRQLVPHLVDLLRDRSHGVVFRSRADGTWLLCSTPERGRPFVDGESPARPGGREVEIAARFKAMVEGRGGRLVLAHVPNPETPRSVSRAIAESIGVPLISPGVEGLESHDGSHLCKRSIGRFAAAFSEGLGRELEAHPLAGARAVAR
jgi:hypothetical protein